MANTELFHHGIKGMKWGVRRYRNKDGTLTDAGRNRERYSNIDKQIKNKRKSDLKQKRSMSDDDLRRRIARLKLEKEYKDLTTADVTPGRKFVSEVISSGAKKALTVSAAGIVAYSVKAAMTKEFNLKDAASYIAANPNKKK